MTAPKKNLNHQLLAQFSGNDSFLTIPKIYYRLTKNLNKSLLLSQVIFYSDKSTYCQDGWFYKTYQEWQTEVFLSVRGMRDLFKELVNESLIEMRVAKVHGTRTPLFRPRLDNIAKAIEALLLSEIDTPEEKPNEQELPQTAESAEKVKNVPKRQKVPDSQTAESAVSITYIQTSTSDKKTTTSKNSGGGDFSKTKLKMLAHKCQDDSRTDEEFLSHCEHHIKNNSLDGSDYKRAMMLIALLKKLFEIGEHFKSKGYVNIQEQESKEKQEKERQRLQAEAQDRQHQERLNSYNKSTEKHRQSKPNQERRGVPTSLKAILGINHAN